MAFGAYTKEHGTKGFVVVRSTNAALAAQMGVTIDELINTIKMLPNMTVKEVENRHGEISVTWQNWVKYQEDATQAERAKASRSKKRGEEIRGEVKKEDAAPPISQNERTKTEIQSLAEAIYGIDKVRFGDIFAWINQKRSAKYEDVDVYSTLLILKKKIDRGGFVGKAWGYLESGEPGYRLIDKLRKERLERESQEHKKAEAAPNVRHLFKGIGGIGE